MVVVVVVVVDSDIDAVQGGKHWVIVRVDCE